MKSPTYAIAVSLLVSTLCGGPQARAQTLDHFFDGSSLQEVRLEIAPQDWQTIHERYLEDTYYRCSFTWRDTTLTGVGIRSRGSQSRSPIKPSIGLDFGKYASGQRFLGLKSLIMRNLNQDASMMRERISEAVFARMGLPYSREAHARLYVNDEYVGVYLLVEPIDARFAQTHFGEDNGWLYEFNNPGTPYLFDSLSKEAEADILSMFEPKTHADSPDAEGLLAMIRFINESTDDEFAAGIDRYLDVPDFLAHAATEQVLSQWDGLIGINGMNNFYFYRRQDTRRGLFLVWDQDMAFVDTWSSIWIRDDQNVLMRRLLGFSQWNRLYLDMLAGANWIVAEDNWMSNQVDLIYGQIRSAVYEDNYRLCRGPDGIEPCSLARFEQDVSELHGFARYRPISVAQDLAASGYPEEGSLLLPPGRVSDPETGLARLASGGTAFVDYPLAPPAAVAVYLGGRAVMVVDVSAAGIVFAVPNTVAYGPQTLALSVDGRLTNSIMVDIRPKE